MWPKKGAEQKTSQEQAGAVRGRAGGQWCAASVLESTCAPEPSQGLKDSRHHKAGGELLEAPLSQCALHV